jgi:hypothetical protein
MLKTSMDQRRRWFRYVNQRLGEISVMLRMNEITEDLKRLPRGKNRKFPISRRAMR